MCLFFLSFFFLLSFLWVGLKSRAGGFTGLKAPLGQSPDGPGCLCSCGPTRTVRQRPTGMSLEGDGKRSKMCYVHVPTPHEEGDHHVL